jgi:Ca2+-binding EF-hand superfamily protein
LFKILALIAFSKIDLHALSLKTELRELQMEVVIMRLEEVLEIKLSQNDLSLFKKEFDSFFLVPLKTLEEKMLNYIGFIHPPPITSLMNPALDLEHSPKIEDYFEISLIVLLNRILEEWEIYQVQLRKRLLKQFIDFDANADGILTLDSFRELMKTLEGANIQNERVIMMYNEALEMSNSIREDGRGTMIGGPDHMAPESFVETVIKNKVGGYSQEFLNFEFLN